jgi:ribosomal RNA-processing protein 1
MHGLSLPLCICSLFDPGAKKETKTRNRDALYQMSSLLEKVAAKKKRQHGAVVGPSGKTSSKKAAAKAAPPATAPAAAPAAPAADMEVEVKVKKSKKRKNGEAVAAGPSSLPKAAAIQTEIESNIKKVKLAPKPAAAVPPRREALMADPASKASIKERKRQKDKKAVAVAGVPQAITSTPSPDNTGRKKNVRWSLKNNLVMTIGEPPAHVDIRTPPTSKPKGSALKKVSTVGAMSVGGGGASKSKSDGKASAAAAAIALAARKFEVKFSPKMTRSRVKGGGGGGPKVPSPQRMQRPRAADFFS